MDNLYATYSKYVGLICDKKDLSGFKSNPDYTYMLEHVSEIQGRQYLECILTLTNITTESIIDFCALNDSVGDPVKQIYNGYLLNKSVSPSSLRYIYHAHLILTQMKAVGNVDVVEVGGGYGGLCLAVHYFASKYGVSINSYRMCDLPNIIRLQKIYLDSIPSAPSVEFVDATSYGENIKCDNMFLISNYCFSEISRKNQDIYRQKLFPKVSHGFMAWNNIPVYDFGFTTRIVPEIPNTGGELNKYVYF
jgi:hypothetical protein